MEKNRQILTSRARRTEKSPVSCDMALQCSDAQDSRFKGCSGMRSNVASRKATCSNDQERGIVVL